MNVRGRLLEGEGTAGGAVARPEPGLAGRAEGREEHAVAERLKLRSGAGAVAPQSRDFPLVAGSAVRRPELRGGLARGAAAEPDEPVEEAHAGDLSAGAAGPLRGAVGDPELGVVRNQPARVGEDVRAAGRDVEIRADAHQAPGAGTGAVGAPKPPALAVVAYEEPDSGCGALDGLMEDLRTGSTGAIRQGRRPGEAVVDGPEKHGVVGLRGLKEPMPPDPLEAAGPDDPPRQLKHRSRAFPGAVAAPDLEGVPGTVGLEIGRIAVHRDRIDIGGRTAVVAGERREVGELASAFGRAVRHPEVLTGLARGEEQMGPGGHERSGLVSSQIPGFVDEPGPLRRAVGAPEPGIASRGAGGHEVEAVPPDGEAARVEKRQPVGPLEEGRSGSGPIAAPELASLVGRGTAGEQETVAPWRNLNRQGKKVLEKVPRQQERPGCGAVRPPETRGLKGNHAVNGDLQQGDAVPRPQRRDARAVVRAEGGRDLGRPPGGAVGAPEDRLVQGVGVRGREEQPPSQREEAGGLSPWRGLEGLPVDVRQQMGHLPGPRGRGGQGETDEAYPDPS